MKNLLTSFIFLLPAFITFSSAQDSSYLQDFQQKWENAAAYTLEVAELMPEDKYDYKPAEDVRTFRDQLMHVMQNMIWLSTSYMSSKKFDKDLTKKDYTKAEVISLLKEAFAFTSEVVKELEPHELRGRVKFFAGPMNVRQTLTLMNDHLTHHRGQMLVYLRLNGIKPPRYRGW